MEKNFSENTLKNCFALVPAPFVFKQGQNDQDLLPGALFPHQQ